MLNYGYYPSLMTQGAQTTMHCALNKDLANESGKMYWNCREWPESERIALTDEDAHRLWEESEKMLEGYMV